MTKKNKTTTLARVEKRFLYWRKTRQKRRPIPDKLWGIACDLAKTLPTTKICKRLGLNCNDFKRRLKQLTTYHGNQEDDQAQFVRIDRGPPEHPPFFFTSNCLIEMQNRNGSILKIFPINGQPVELDSIIRSFTRG